MLRIAGMMHDSRKSGSQEDFENNKYTKFDHPLLAAEVIRSFDGKYLNHEEIECISDTISTHMGQWCKDKRSNIVLPTPQNRFQKILHWADYLASRKDIEMRFERAIPTPAEYRFTFGKHNGETLEEVTKSDPSYIEWLKTTELRFPLDKLLT